MLEQEQDKKDIVSDIDTTTTLIQPNEFNICFSWQDPWEEPSYKEVNIIHLEIPGQWIFARPAAQISKFQRILKYVSGIPALHWSGIALALILVVAGLYAGPVMLTVAGVGLAVTVAVSLWEINRSK